MNDRKKTTVRLKARLWKPAKPFWCHEEAPAEREDLKEEKRKSISISSSQLWSPCHFSPAKATPSPCSLPRERQRKRGRRKSCWHSRLAFQDGKVWKISQHHPLTSKTARWLQSSTGSVTWPVSCPFPLQNGTRGVFLDPSHPPRCCLQCDDKDRKQGGIQADESPSHTLHTEGKVLFVLSGVPSYDFPLPSLSSLGDYQRNELVISISSRWKKCWCHPESGLWESCFILPRRKGQPRWRCQSWNQSLRPNRPLWSNFLHVRVAPLTRRKALGLGPHQLCLLRD